MHRRLVKPDQGEILIGKGLVDYFAAHRTLTFFAIFLVSFSIRFALLVHYRGEIMVDIGERARIAKALVTKGQFADPFAIPTGPTAHTTPFFPLLDAGIFKILGIGFRGQFARCLLVISGWSLLVALYPTFASAFGFRFGAGLAAGFIFALVPVRRSAEVFRGAEEPWAAMALAILLFLTMKRYDSTRRDPVSAVWLGLCWGFTLYISFSLFSVLVALLLLDLLSHRSLRVLGDVCVTLVVTLAILTPWTLRNHRELHGWIAMRDNLGLELLFGNHDYAHPSVEQNGDDPLTLSSFTHPGKSIPEATLVRDLGEVNYNRRALHLALAWIRDHPRHFAVLTAERFCYFWLGSLDHAYELIVVGLYTLLGLAGLGVIRKEVGDIQFRLWCTVFIFYPLIYYCVPFSQRYRVPIDWMIWLSAGLFVSIVLKGFIQTQAAVPVRAG